MCGHIFLCFQRFEYFSYDVPGELEVSSSRLRVSLLFTVERGRGEVSKMFPSGTVAGGPRNLMKKSAGQDKCSGRPILVLMTPTL